MRTGVETECVSPSFARRARSAAIAERGQMWRSDQWMFLLVAAVRPGTYRDPERPGLLRAPAQSDECR